MNKKLPPLARRLILWPIYTLLGISVLLVLIPFIVRIGLFISLEKISGGDATVGDIDFNPFTTQLVINDLALEKAEARLLKIDQLRLKLAGWPGINKHIEVEYLDIIGPSITLERFGEGAIFIGGLSMPADEKEEHPPEPEGRPWSFALNELNIEKGKILYLESGLNSELDIEKLQIGPLDTRRPETDTRIVLHSLFDGTPLMLDATTHPLAAEPDVAVDITLDPLPLGRYAKLVRPHISRLSGKITFNTHIAGRLKENGTLSIDQNGKVALDSFLMTHPEASVTNKSLIWKGQSHITLPSSSSLSFKVDGKLDGKDLDVVMSGQQLHLSQHLIDIKTTLTGEVNQDGSLNISQQGDVKLRNLQLQQGEMSLTNDLVSWQGKSNVRKSASSRINFDLDGNLNGSKLELLIPAQQLEFQQQQFDFSTRVTGEMSEDGVLLVTQQGGIKLEQLALKHETADVVTELIEWQGNSHVTLPTGEDASPIVETEGTISNRKLDLKLKVLPLNITQKEINWQGKSKLSDGLVDLAGEAVLTGLSARSSKDNFELLAYDKVDVKQLHFSNGTSLDIEAIEVDGLVARFEQTRKGRWRVIEDLKQDKEEKSLPPEKAAAQIEQKSSEPALAYRIGQLRIGGKSRIEFIDDTVSPPFTQVAHIKLLEIGTIDSSKPKQSSSLKLDSRLGKYATFKLDGKVYPFAKRPTLEVKGGIKSFSLPPVSPYAVNTLGYYVHSGQLTTDITLKIDQGIMDGKTVWHIGQLDLEMAKKEGDNLDNSLGMPVETALSMVSDNKGNINLTIPITGDIEDPQFNIQDAINKALAKGVQKGALTYLKYTLQPFGAALIAADMAKGLAGGVRLDPIILQTGRSDIGNEHDEYLKKVAGMLGERKQLHIRICGYAVESDRKKLLEEAIAKAAAEKKKKSSEQAKQAEAPTINDEALLELAKARSDNIKGRLVSDHQIDPARLFICHPQIDKSSDGQPRVEMLI